MESYLMWFIVAGVLLLAEALSPGAFISACFALSALIVGTLDFVLILDLKISIAIFFVTSFVFLLTVKPLLRSLIKLPKSEATYYSNKLIGQEAMVFKAIAQNQPGTVKLYDADEAWIAKSKDGSEIGVGTTVKIVEVEGNHLIVESL